MQVGAYDVCSRVSGEERSQSDSSIQGIARLGWLPSVSSELTARGARGKLCFTCCNSSGKGRLLLLGTMGTDWRIPWEGGGDGIFAIGNVQASSRGLREAETGELAVNRKWYLKTGTGEPGASNCRCWAPPKKKWCKFTPRMGSLTKGK